MPHDDQRNPQLNEGQHSTNSSVANSGTFSLAEYSDDRPDISAMTSEEVTRLMSFVQKERLHLLGKLKNNFTYHFLFIFLGISVLVNYEAAQVLLDKWLPADYDTITPVIPFLLIFQFVSFGYLMGLYIRNSRVVKWLVHETTKNIDYTKTEINKRDIRNLSRTHTFLEPFYDEKIFANGKILYFLYYVSIGSFFLVNHFIVYEFITLFDLGSNLAKGLYITVFVLISIFQYHFYFSFSNVKAIKLFVGSVFIINLAMCIAFILKGSLLKLVI